MSTQRRPIRQYARAIYDPEPRAIYDPDPDPIGAIAIGILAFLGIFGIVSWQNPNLWNNLLISLSPAVAEETKADREARLKEFAETVKLVYTALAITAGLVVLYIFWRWTTQKKRSRYFNRRMRY